MMQQASKVVLVEEELWRARSDVEW